MRGVRLSALFFAFVVAAGAARPSARLVRVGEGWARNQVNAVIFRRNSVVSRGRWQYVAFYDAEARVVLAKRRLGSTRWEVRRTQYAGDASDAHRSISIAVDGRGFLHVVWNQHDSPLQYCRSVRPGSLELSARLPMLGEKEQKVTYPEFYALPGGRLLFLYRDGASGGGDLVLDRVAKGISTRRHRDTASSFSSQQAVPVCPRG